jgi:hypothetical protein
MVASLTRTAPSVSTLKLCKAIKDRMNLRIVLKGGKAMAKECLKFRYVLKELTILSSSMTSVERYMTKMMSSPALATTAPRNDERIRQLRSTSRRHKKALSYFITPKERVLAEAESPHPKGLRRY